MIERLRREWVAGLNRFDREGEILVGAFRRDQLVGVGGLNRDPYVEDPAVGRIRHVYVLNEERRRAVGRGLIACLIKGADEHFNLVRLRTGRASAFYDSLGFAPTDEPNATHQLTLPAPSQHVGVAAE